MLLYKMDQIRSNRKLLTTALKCFLQTGFRCHALLENMTRRIRELQQRRSAPLDSARTYQNSITCTLASLVSSFNDTKYTKLLYKDWLFRHCNHPPRRGSMVFSEKRRLPTPRNSQFPGKIRKSFWTSNIHRGMAKEPGTYCHIRNGNREYNPRKLMMKNCLSFDLE